jgi:hypothetical protein
MNQLLTACESILGQLEYIVRQVNDRDFARPSSALSQATIGQHLRHTIEFFICLEDGFERGAINYDQRQRDQLIESDRQAALEVLLRIKKFTKCDREERKLVLEVAYERNHENWLSIETNYHRELIYNIEHAVHHMAIMKIGIREVAPYVQLPDDFGVAVSTLRFNDAVSAG